MSRPSSDPVLLWCRLGATAPIQALAWEPVYAANGALKNKKRKRERERKKERERERERKEGRKKEKAFRRGDLKLELAPDSPGGLINIQIAGPHPQSFWLSRSRLGPRNVHFEEILALLLKLMMLVWWALHQDPGTGLEDRLWSKSCLATR